MQGVFTGEGAGGALIVAADLALGELVEEQAAGFVEGLGGDDFAAEVAEVGEPVAGVERELGVDLFAEALGEGGRVSGGGDGDLEVAAADDGREVEVAEGWVVDGVAEDVVGGGSSKTARLTAGTLVAATTRKCSGEVAVSGIRADAR